MSATAVVSDPSGSARDPREERRPRTWRPEVVLGVTVVVVLFAVPLRGLLRAEGGPMEEGFMLVFPERVLDGDVPNRDFLHLYGPGSLWVLAAAFELLGTSIVTERLVALAQQVGLVVGVLVVARRAGWATATAGAAVAAVVTITPIGLVALAWVGGLALALWALHCGLEASEARDARRGRRLALTAGLLGGAALLYRPDLVVATGLGLGVAWWSMARDRRGRLALGLALGVSPYLVHLAMAGVGSSITGMVLEPVFELRDGRSLPVPPSASDLDGFLQKIAELDALSWPAPFTTPEQLRLWFFVLLAAVAALVFVGIREVRRDRSSPSARALLAVALLSVGTLPQALQRPDSTHLAWVSAVPLGFLPVAIGALLPPRWRSDSGRRGLLAGGVVVALLALAFPFFTLRRYADYSLQSVDRHRSAHAITHEGRTFYYGRQDVAAELEEVLDEADAITEPGDRLFVGLSDLRFTPYVDSFVYFLLPELDPATRFIEMDPGIANAADSGLAEDLASADIAVLGSVWLTWVEPNSSGEAGSDEPNAVLARDFCPVRLSEHWQLFERCDRRPRPQG